MTQQGHRGLYPDVSLIVVSKNHQEKNGVGVEVQSLQVVLAENSKEELGERRHQTGDNGAHKERIEGAPLDFRLVGASLEHSRPLAALRHRHQVREGEVLLRQVRGNPELTSTRPRSGTCEAPWRAG